MNHIVFDFNVVQICQTIVKGQTKDKTFKKNQRKQKKKSKLKITKKKIKPKIIKKKPKDGFWFFLYLIFSAGPCKCKMSTHWLKSSPALLTNNMNSKPCSRHFSFKYKKCIMLKNIINKKFICFDKKKTQK